MFLSFVFQAALNTEDPQYQDKRMVAQRNGRLSIQAFNVWIQNTIRTVKVLSYTWFHVILFLTQVYAGKEKEAVLDMLPYLRLGYVTHPSEMQSVISSQGPVCPVSFSCPHYFCLLVWGLDL